MNPSNPPLPFVIGSLILIAWTLFWKGLAMWRAVKLGQRNWFIAFIILNHPLFTTLGLLEIAYLFFFAKKKMTLGEIKELFRKESHPKHHEA